MIKKTTVKAMKSIHKSFLSSMVSGRSRSFCSRRVIDMAANEGELRVFMVSGEVSGDAIASRLMASLKHLSPFPVLFAGVGGSVMIKEGLQSLFPMEDIAVMGIWELLPHLRKIRMKLEETTEAAILFRPHVVVTVDSKARCSQNGLDGPLHIHYVAPSFWAWKGGETRLKGLCGFVDHLLCILPFEEEVCRSNGLAATFVGHPILEDTLNSNMGRDTPSNKWMVQGNGEGFRSKHGLSSGATIITVLPGSRLQEVTRMLPIFSNTLKLLKDSFPELTTVIPVAPNQHVENYIDRAIQTWPVPNILVSGGLLNLKYDVFNASRAALSTSGTAVMELQLARLPCVVAYRAHFLTEWVIRFKSKLEFISLPNILLKSPVIPEALFQECTPKNLAALLRGRILVRWQVLSAQSDRSLVRVRESASAKWGQVIRDDGSREQQIVAAEKVFELLLPSVSKISQLAPKESGSLFANYCPSMIAAFTILCSARRR